MLLTDRAARRIKSDSELLSIELLEEHARRLAAMLSLSLRRHGQRRTHLRQLKAHMQALRETYTLLAEDARREPMPPAAEWLLDNFHIATAAARDIQRDLPPAYFSRLPRVAADEFAGLPRIYALALELIGSSAGRLDPQRLQRFVTRLPVGHAADDGRALGVAERVEARANRASARARPTCWRTAARIGVTADRLAAAPRRSPLLGEWPAGVHHAFVAGCCSARGGSAPWRRDCTTSSKARWRRVGDDRGRDPRRGTAPGRRAGVHVANLIGSLRLIGTFDWSEFFESVSLVEQVLQRDPAGVYARMDFRSRDRYRHAVEELAEPTGDGQLRVALKAVERARQVAGADARCARRARRLLPDWRRAPPVRAERRLAPDARAANPAGVLSRTRPPAISARSPLGTAVLVAAALRYATRTAGAARRCCSWRC